MEELQKLGVELTQKQIDREMKAIEHHRQQMLHKKRKQRQYERQYSENQDGTFFFIAGYTSGGVPYGVTWEEMGMTPFEDDEVL